MKLVIGCKNTLVPICKFHFTINCMMIAGAECGIYIYVCIYNWKVILSEIFRFQSQSPVSFVWHFLCCYELSLFYFSFRTKHTQTQNSLLSVHKE